MSERREDLPKIVAGIMIAIPSLTLKTGWAYLRMRKRAQKVSRTFEAGMLNEGVPPEFAHQLANDFAEDLSIRNIVRDIGIPGFGQRR